MRQSRKSLGTVPVALAALLLAAPAFADLAHDVQHLQQRWAEVNYQLEGHTQLAAFEQLTADAKGGFGALSLARGSKADLEQALSIEPQAMQGSAYTSLGALYYSVPGWPLSFGDDDKAELLLKQALALNPNGIDANFFYTDYLISAHRYTQARTYLLKAQQAPPRPGRAVADSGRQREISAKLRVVADK